MTGRVELICGKVCSGKSTYAETLRQESGGVVLSADRLMLALFPVYLGDRHEEISGKCRAYLLDQAVDLARAGVPVILDWGFWTAESRREATAFFRERDISVRWHYVAVSEAQWLERAAKRNREAPKDAYPVDENLLQKCRELFQEPRREEIDCWIGP